MWLGERVEISFCKKFFMNSKWSNLNAQWYYTLCCHSILESIILCPFRGMQEKKILHLAFEIYIWKTGIMVYKSFYLDALGL